jgi:phosphate transport system protein
MREVQKLKKHVLSLGTLAEESVANAVKSIRDRDRVLAQKVIEGDIEIDDLEVEVEEECQKILALHQPVAHDLRFIIAVLKISSELEHIGDASVNIAERAVFLAGTEQINIPFDFTTMSEKARFMLRTSLNALVDQDANLAYQVIKVDDEVDAINREMYGQVKEGIRKHPEHLEALIHLLSVSRHVERIGDHASNIAEEVVYFVKGDIIRHKTEEFLAQTRRT